jgi:CBS domain containing-hemolysin-like protein
MRDRAKRRKFRKEFKPSFKLSRVGTVVSIVALTFVLGLLYLSQSNQMATSGYDIAKLEKKQQELRLETERLQIEASRLQSIQNLDSGIAKSGMVPVSKINYVPANTNVAVNIK